MLSRPGNRGVHDLRDPTRPGTVDQIDSLRNLAVEPAAVHVGHLHGEDGTDSFGGLAHGAPVVQVTGDQFCTARLDGLCPGRQRIAHQRPDGNTRCEQCARGGTTLATGGANDQDRGGVCTQCWLLNLRRTDNKWRGPPFISTTIRRTPPFSKIGDAAMTVQRADARRNYALILAVAEEEVATHGADASLEQIARTAGVGSATVRRHFPSRRALLEAVFSSRIDALCNQAEDLAGSGSSPRAALVEWLGALATYATSARGLADALLQDGTHDAAGEGKACSDRLCVAAEPLLHRAAQAGAVTPEVTTSDLISLITGLVLATEHHPNPAAEANRLLTVLIRGISPCKEEARHAFGDDDP